MHDNGIEIYSLHNKEKPVTTEKFIRTLKSKIYRHMTVVSMYTLIT